jgi:GT2 family glycosyltransferase
VGVAGGVERVPMKQCTILLVNWNGWADTIECLESLFRLGYPSLRVIVCDNGSQDGSLEKIISWADGSLDVFLEGDNALRKHSWPPAVKPVSLARYDRTLAEQGGEVGDSPQLVLIDTGDNLGFAGGNNVGLRYLMARGDFDYVWLLNNDTVVAPEALNAMVARMQEKPHAGICGSTLLLYDVPEKVQARGGGWYCKWIGLPWHIGQLDHANDVPNVERVERWMNYVVGASMLVSKGFLTDVGLMCEDYFLYFEETDWAMRAKGRYSLAYAPESRVFHKVGSSIGTRSNPAKKSVVCDFYSVRNRLLFTWRYFPIAFPFVCATLLGAIVLRLLLGKWLRAKMIAKLMFTFKTTDRPFADLK